MLASPLEADSGYFYHKIHHDQWETIKHLQKELNALASRLDQVIGNQQHSLQSATAIGVDAHENVIRIGKEVQGLKVILHGIEKHQGGYEVKQLRKDFNTLSERVQAAELDQERIDRAEARIYELGNGLEAADLRNLEFRDTITKDFEDIPRITPQYKKLLKEGTEFGYVLQHLSDVQEGQDIRLGNTETKVFAVEKNLETTARENKYHLDQIQAFVPRRETPLTIGHKNIKQNLSGNCKG